VISGEHQSSLWMCPNCNKGFSDPEKLHHHQKNDEKCKPEKSKI